METIDGTLFSDGLRQRFIIFIGRKRTKHDRNYLIAADSARSLAIIIIAILFSDTGFE